jgi:hypothetical protein
MARQRHKWDVICDRPRNLHAPVRIDPTGQAGPTRGQAAGRKWRQVAPGWYVPISADPDVPEQRIPEATVLLPPCGAITGWAALRWRRAGLLDGVGPDGVTRLPVPLNIGPNLHRAGRDDVAYLRDRLPETELSTLHGVRCVKAERAVFDEMRRAETVTDAVVVFDMTAAAQLTSLSRIRAYVEAHPGWDGLPLARKVLDLADENSWSPLESRVRLVWVVDAGRPRPLTNRPVFERSSERLLGYADLLDPVAGVVGEVDGGEHGRPGRRSKDAVRDDRFRNHGLETFRATSYDLHHPAALVGRIHAAYRRAERRSHEARTWTLTRPAGWEPEPSLDGILEEREYKAELYARYEREPQDASVIGG